MKLLLRILLALALVLTGGAGAVGPASAAEPPAEAMDCCDSRCPCAPAPAPTGLRLPTGAAAPAVVSTLPQVASARKASPRESTPVPAEAVGLGARDAAEVVDPCAQPRGRDPDLGRHLAHLRRLRI